MSSILVSFRASTNVHVQYILRKAFDCSPDGKVCISILLRCSSCLIFHYSLTFPSQSSGDRRSSSPTVWDTLGLTGTHIPSTLYTFFSQLTIFTLQNQRKCSCNGLRRGLCQEGRTMAKGYS